jgi:hypothetical protein
MRKTEVSFTSLAHFRNAHTNLHRPDLNMQLTSIVSLMAALAASASAAGIHINYYTDGGCSNYASSPPNVPIDGGCYNWQWNGANSANIANCDYKECWCTFYTQPNCQGAAQALTYSGDNCASNWGQGYVSFKCAVQYNF